MDPSCNPGQADGQTVILLMLRKEALVAFCQLPLLLAAPPPPCPHPLNPPPDKLLIPKPPPFPLTLPPIRPPSIACHYAATWSAQHSTAQHSTAQHSTAQHSTAQHSTATALHCTALHAHRRWLACLPPHASLLLGCMCVLVHGSRHQRPLLELIRCKTTVAAETATGKPPSMKLHRTLQTTGVRHPSQDTMLTDRSKHTQVGSAIFLLSHTFRHNAILHYVTWAKPHPRCVYAGAAAYTAAP